MLWCVRSPCDVFTTLKPRGRGREQAQQSGPCDPESSVQHGCNFGRKNRHWPKQGWGLSSLPVAPCLTALKHFGHYIGLRPFHTDYMYLLVWYSLDTTSRGIYDSDSSLGSSAQQSHRVSLSELPHLELSFDLKLSSAKPKRSSAHLCSSAPLYGSNDKAGVFMGVVTQRKGHGETARKQRGSGEYSASEDNAAKNISESRMHEQDNNGRRQYG